MKKLIVTALSFGALTVASEAFAHNSSIVFAGANSGRNIAYGYLGAATALNGNIEKNGVLLRASGAYGRYTYQTQAVTGGNVRGDLSTSDFMLGYQQNLDFGRLTVYGGGTHENQSLNKGDGSNRVVGGRNGVKGQIELTLKLTKNLVGENISNYSTPFHSYWSQTFVGYDFDKFTFGPEVALLGNTAFNQQRFGAKVGNISLCNNTKLYVSGGYLKSSGLLGNDGGYAAVGIASKF